MPMPPPHPPEPAPPPSPPMVLVDRHVGFVDELDEIFKELRGMSLRESLNSARRAIPPCRSNRGWQDNREWSNRATEEEDALDIHAKLEEEALDIHAKLEEKAFDILLLRKATTHPSAVRKEPFPPGVKASIYGLALCGIDPCLSDPVADPPSVTRLSLKISWPPGQRADHHPSAAFITSCHHCFLVLNVGNYRPGIYKYGFYLVYNAWANSAAIVPPLFRVFGTSHFCIGLTGVVLLCLRCDKEGVEYVLAELLLHRDVRSTLPTNKATLFIWESSSSGRWVEREVLLPIPVSAAAAAYAVADEEQDTTTTFRADMAFAVSFSSICWVDLLTGILVYNHIHSGQFHFIPLPEECVINTGTGMTRQCSVQPDEYRSMCCIDRQTLKLVSIDVYNHDRPNTELIRIWTLRQPLSPTNWKWDKDVVLSNFRIRDLWDDPVYKDMLKLRPIWPSYPVISTRQPHIIYLSIYDNEFRPSYQVAGGIDVLCLNLRTCRVESAYKIPSGENEFIPRPSLFTSDFSSYLNKSREWDMIHGRRHYLFEVPMEMEVADEGESRSKRPSNPYTVGVDLGMLKLSRGGLGPSSRKTGGLASSSCPVGLQAALDIAIGGEAA